jgi:hypothetical protein
VVALLDNGAQTLDTINTCDAANANRVLYINCGTMNNNIVNGSNLNLAADFACAAAGDMLTLICDGTNWNEVSRSNN